MGDERVGELHNDEPSEHELTDSDDMYDNDDYHVDNAPNASVEDQSINIILQRFHT